MRLNENQWFWITSDFEVSWHFKGFQRVFRVSWQINREFYDWTLFSEQPFSRRHDVGDISLEFAAILPLLNLRCKVVTKSEHKLWTIATSVHWQRTGVFLYASLQFVSELKCLLDNFVRKISELKNIFLKENKKENIY